MFNDLKLQQEFTHYALKRSFEKGTVLLFPGDEIVYVPIVISGIVRVILQNTKGEEYFLYHIFPNESCASTLSNCQSNKKSEVKAIIEENAEVFLIPKEKVDEWMQFKEWKLFVNDTQSQRFSELVETIELMAFGNLYEQLWHYLVKRSQAQGQSELKITHQEIANELNSPREVITRLLHQLQKHNKVELSRNTIRIQ